VSSEGAPLSEVSDPPLSTLPASVPPAATGLLDDPQAAKPSAAPSPPNVIATPRTHREECTRGA